MATPLSADREGANLTRGTFLEFVQKHDDIDQEIASAKETMRSLNRRRKDIRKSVEANGITIAEFDRALDDRNRSDDELEASHRQYQRNLAWLGKPVGFQSDLGLPVETAADTKAATVYQMKQVDTDGYNAGRAGYAVSLNQHAPGTEEYQRWHNAWLRGQEAKIKAEIKPTEAPKRGRGRPRKNGAAPETPGAQQASSESPPPGADDQPEPPTLVQPESAAEPPRTPGLPQSSGHLH